MSGHPCYRTPTRPLLLQLIGHPRQEAVLPGLFDFVHDSVGATNHHIDGRRGGAERDAPHAVADRASHTQKPRR